LGGTVRAIDALVWIKLPNRLLPLAVAGEQTGGSAEQKKKGASETVAEELAPGGRLVRLRTLRVWGEALHGCGVDLLAGKADGKVQVSSQRHP
jgi:hypothetical protein